MTFDKEILKRFYFDAPLKEEWSGFVMAILDEAALHMVYNGLDTTGIKVARKILIKAFEKLDDEFKEKKKQVLKTKGI